MSYWASADERLTPSTGVGRSYRFPRIAAGVTRAEGDDRPSESLPRLVPAYQGGSPVWRCGIRCGIQDAWQWYGGIADTTWSQRLGLLEELRQSIGDACRHEHAQTGQS